MTLDELLMDDESSLLDDAYAALQRSHVTHYEAAGERVTRQRLADLLHLVVDAIRTRNLAEMSEYSEAVAVERFNQGFDISEVQTAYNALEEVAWRRVVRSEPAADLPEAIGLLSTVLGYGKDALSRKYVSLASERHVPTLDLSALFEGMSS
ncbi:MAG: RsbRD N-terminal domain-containing protein [Candidatus Nanopelagicales bacterium]